MYDEQLTLTIPAALLLRYLDFQSFFWRSLALMTLFSLIVHPSYLKSKDALDVFA